MKLTRKVLTTVALSGVLLAGAAVPAQAAIDPPIRTCRKAFEVPQRVRVWKCTDGSVMLQVWNRRTHQWRLVWQR